MIDLDGRSIAKRIKAEVRTGAEEFRRNGIIPKLAIIIATTDDGAWWYVRSIEKAAHAVGIEVDIIDLPPAVTTEVFTEKLKQLAADQSVHGIMLQTPLPETVDTELLIGLIPADKDVDGLNPLSAGRLLYGEPAFAPATAEAVMVMLDQYQIDPAGKEVVVVGRSRVVGKPVSMLLLSRDATVTICHTRTDDLSGHTSKADILIVAAGKPNLITANMVSPVSIVIDVGTNVVGDHQLVGDVAAGVGDIVAALTPVPGGVGPVTTAIILQHTLTSVRLQP